MQSRPTRIVPYADASDYLHQKYGFPKVTQHTQRVRIRRGSFPVAFEYSPGCKGYTEDVLDAHALKVLSQNP
jgi:hypothetical protein